MHETGQFADFQIGGSAGSQIQQEFVEREFLAKVLLKLLAQDHGVNRGAAQVIEEPGVLSDFSVVFPALEVPQDTGDFSKDLIEGLRHGLSLCNKIVAMIKSILRTVLTVRGTSIS